MKSSHFWDGNPHSLCGISKVYDSKLFFYSWVDPLLGLPTLLQKIGEALSSDSSSLRDIYKDLQELRSAWRKFIVDLSIYEIDIHLSIIDQK